MIRTEGKVPYLCLIVLLLRTVLNQRKQEEDVKIINSRRKKVSYICWDVNLLFQLVPICTILLAAEEKKCFPKKLREKNHTYIFMTILFSCSRFTSPWSEDGNKKVPFVCLFVAVLTTRKKDKTQRQKKTWKKFDISILFVQLPPVRTILHWDVTSTGGGVRLWDADSDCRKG